MTKICSYCLLEKELNNFYKHPDGKDGYRTICKKCDYNRVKEYKKKYNYDKKYLKRDQFLLRKYNITSEYYNELFLKQEGRCLICNKHQSEFKKSLAIDHNHENGEVRGLLCGNCNTAIGLLKESIDLLENAKNYLENYKSKPKPAAKKK